MFGVHDLTLFIVSGLLLNITPGPDSLYIIGRSATQGWRAGAAAAFGIGAGTMVHVLAAAFGLSAILATSATAFTIVKLIGAAYLLYVGAGMLFKRAAKADAGQDDVSSRTESGPASASMRQIFSQGFLTNVLNPKVALFFLAFVPQFIDPVSPHKALAFVFLGVVFNVNGMLWCNFLAWSAATASARFKGNGKLANLLNRATGGLFVALGIKLVLSRQN
ncbi:MAG TPA: LysE family translocator [Burkholderiaceae bacterium]|jgi:threonine/homoserine/homoserine lactone efflux protein